MDLKELRTCCDLTQPQAAQLMGIPLRTYCRYEARGKRQDSFKYQQMIRILENHLKSRVLSLGEIKETVSSVCSRYTVDACYLFGSYAKSKATKDSDVDLMIVSSVDGLEYYGLLGELEEKLGKKVDLIRLEIAVQNVKLLNEILKDGVKIYG